MCCGERLRALALPSPEKQRPGDGLFALCKSLKREVQRKVLCLPGSQ